MNMKPAKIPLPQNRSLEQVWNHYVVEKEIASRLKSANREQRREIYATMYDVLFEKVPDHSRLQIRDDPSRVARANRGKWDLIQSFIHEDQVFVEFAPGGCRFSFEVCQKVRKVIGIDISDQMGNPDSVPDNFELIVYDGFELDMEPESVDLVFSDQLLEHLHPEDTRLHFELVYGMLRPSGKYVFRTPHRFSGPHDISAFFSEDKPEGFHLKEWTFGEFDQLLPELGFRSWKAYRLSRGRLIPIPLPALLFLEAMIGGLSRRKRVALARRFLQSVIMAVEK